MKRSTVFLAILALILFALLIWPRGQFRIHSVENGNTILLDNGTMVQLIGVNDTPASKEFLNDNYLGAEVALLSDSSSPFNPNSLSGNETIHAYVIQKSDNQCINSTLLRSGLSTLNEAYLSDSLKSFRKIYELAKQRN